MDLFLRQGSGRVVIFLRKGAGYSRWLRDARVILNRSQGEMRRRWETNDEDGSFSRYG